MIPNLREATNTYWRNLNELNAAYRRGEVSIEEVDQRVALLMEELGQERRASVKFLLNNVNRIWREQQEIVVALGLMGVLAYAWIATSLTGID